MLYFVLIGCCPWGRSRLHNHWACFSCTVAVVMPWKAFIFCGCRCWHNKQTIRIAWGCCRQQTKFCRINTLWGGCYGSRITACVYTLNFAAARGTIAIVVLIVKLLLLLLKAISSYNSCGVVVCKLVIWTLTVEGRGTNASTFLRRLYTWNINVCSAVLKIFI
jgi:hypothetical protein